RGLLLRHLALQTALQGLALDLLVDRRAVLVDPHRVVRRERGLLRVLGPLLLRRAVLEIRDALVLEPRARIAFCHNVPLRACRPSPATPDDRHLTERPPQKPNT